MINREIKDNELNELLNVLINIKNNEGDIYLSDNDERTSRFGDLKKLLNELNNDGFFSYYKDDVIGGIEIELSKKAFDI